jgi:hypothetical protein
MVFIFDLLGPSKFYGVSTRARCGDNELFRLYTAHYENTFAGGLMLNISASSSSSSSSSSNRLIVERLGAGLETSAVWKRQNTI